MRRQVPKETPNRRLCPPPEANGQDVRENGTTVIPDPNTTVHDEPAPKEQSANKRLCQLQVLDKNLLQCSAKEKAASSKSKSSSSAAGMCDTSADAHHTRSWRFS